MATPRPVRLRASPHRRWTRRPKPPCRRITARRRRPALPRPSRRPAWSSRSSARKLLASPRRPGSREVSSANGESSRRRLIEATVRTALPCAEAIVTSCSIPRSTEQPSSSSLMSTRPGRTSPSTPLGSTSRSPVTRRSSPAPKSSLRGSNSTTTTRAATRTRSRFAAPRRRRWSGCTATPSARRPTACSTSSGTVATTCTRPCAAMPSSITTRRCWCTRGSRGARAGATTSRCAATSGEMSNSGLR